MIACHVEKAEDRYHLDQAHIDIVYDDTTQIPGPTISIYPAGCAQCLWLKVMQEDYSASAVLVARGVTCEESMFAA